MSLAVRWSKPALRSFARAKEYYSGAREGLGDRFEGAVVHALRSLQTQPERARASRQVPGVRLWSLSGWHKVIAVEQRGNDLIVLAIRDTRRRSVVA
jgi:plasmid stabilization system protein ParE